MINKKPLLNFLLWSISLIFICIIGISNVFALEYSTTYADTQTYYDNYGSSATLVGSTWNSSLQAYVSNSIGTTANSYGALVVFNSPIAIIANHTYTLSFSFLERYNIAVSSKPRVAIGNTVEGTKYNYVNGQYYSTTLVDKVVNTSIIQYVFTATGSANYIAIPWTTTSNTSQTYAFNTIIIEDLGSEGISESTINNSLANQTNTINNYIQNSTNTITSNADANRDAIIDNQNANNDALIENDNANTDKIIEENKKNFQTCRDSYNLFDISKVVTNGEMLINNGDNLSISTPSGSSAVIGSSPHKLKDYCPTCNVGETYTLSAVSTGTSKFIYLLQENRTWNFGSSLTITNTILNSDIYWYASGVSTQATISKIQIQKGSTATDYEPYGEEICFNKLDEQKNAINNLNDSITSDNVDDSDIGDAFDDFNEFLDDNSTITQLITLPVTLYTAILNNLNGTCSPFNLGNLFGTDLILPCINISQYLGSALWTMIDIIISGFAIYEIAKKFIKVFNNLSSLREGDVIDD